MAHHLAIVNDFIAWADRLGHRPNRSAAILFDLQVLAGEVNRADMAYAVKTYANTRAA